MTAYIDEDWNAYSIWGLLGSIDNHTPLVDIFIRDQGDLHARDGIGFDVCELLQSTIRIHNERLRSETYLVDALSSRHIALLLCLVCY